MNRLHIWGALALILGASLAYAADTGEMESESPPGGTTLDVDGGGTLETEDQLPPPGTIVEGEEIKVGPKIDPPPIYYDWPFDDVVASDPPPYFDPWNTFTYIADKNMTTGDETWKRANTVQSTNVIKFFNCRRCHDDPNFKNVWIEYDVSGSPPTELVVELRRGTY